jgi:hypothetical protein
MDTKQRAKQIVQESLEESINWGKVGRDIGTGARVATKFVYSMMKPIVKSAAKKGMSLVSSAGFAIGNYFKSKLEPTVESCVSAQNKNQVKQIVQNNLTHGKKVDDKTANFIADFMESMKMNIWELDDDYFVNKYLVNKSPKQTYQEINKQIPANSPIRHDSETEEETLSEISTLLISSYIAMVEKQEQEMGY